MTLVKSREQAHQSIAALARAHRAVHCDDVYLARAHAQIVPVLIVLLNLLCTLPYTPTVLLEYTSLQLGCIEYYCYLHACE